MITLKEFLDEEKEDKESDEGQLFNFNTLKTRLLPKMQDVMDGNHEYENIPGHIYIEILDILQLTKQILIDTLEGEEKSESDTIVSLKDKMREGLKIMYPNANVSELFNVINKEILSRIKKIGINKVLVKLDSNDMSMDSKDDFGMIMYRIFHNELKKEDVDQNALSLIKRWDDKIKITGETLSTKVRNRKMLKDKLFSRIEANLDENDEEIDDIEDDIKDDSKLSDEDTENLKDDTEDKEPKQFNFLNDLANDITKKVK